jgi:hypothetical protein
MRISALARRVQKVSPHGTYYVEGLREHDH